jgi:hypothetical protein
MIKERKVFKIFGKVVEKETGEGIPNLTVKAFDKDLLFDDLLGAVTTDKNGNFEIIYDKEDFQKLFFDKKPDLYLKINTPEGELIHITEDKVRYKADRTEEFTVLIPADVYSPFLPSFKATVLRPEDMLKLDFIFFNLKLQDGKLVHINSKKPAYIVVEFPPQNIAEEAFFESAKDTEDPTKVAFPVEVPQGKVDIDQGKTDDEIPHVPVQSRISGPSRLVFKVPKDAEINYSIEGLLETCSKYELEVATTALPPPPIFFERAIDPSYLIKRVSMFKHIDLNTITPMHSGSAKAGNPSANLSSENALTLVARAKDWIARSTLKKYLPQAYDKAIGKQIAKHYYELKFKLIPPELRKPTGIETSIEAPYRLILSPNHFAAWAHALKPVSSPTSKRIELWHTRHALRLDGKINEQEDRLRTVRAIWTRDYGFDKDDPGNVPQHSNKPFRMSLDSFDRHNIVHLSANYYINNYLPLPIQVERLMLTSLGTWMNVRGAWDPPSMLSVEEWRHRGTMGRDHYVRVVYKGYLFPFGHRASLIKVTERKFHPQIKSLLSLAQHLFVQKMDSQVKTIEFRSQPEINSFMRAVNDNFEKVVTSLVESIEGKSCEGIASLVKESEREFHEKTALLVNTTRDKWRGEIASLAETAKDEFRRNIDSVIKGIEGMAYQDVPGSIAYLRQRMYIVVREPEKLYVYAGLKNQDGHSYDLQMPFSHIRITTLVTPNLDDPAKCQIKNMSGQGQSLFWPRVGGKDFQFHLIAEDFAANQTEFTAPLIFVDQSILNYKDLNGSPIPSKYENDVRNLVEKVRDDYQNNVKPKINGQLVMFADGGDNPGKTAFETQYMTFSAEIPDNPDKYEALKQNLSDDDIPCFYPKVVEAEVVIPSIKHLTGNNQTATIKYYYDYLKKGFDQAEVFAELIGGGIALNFNSQGDRSGGVIKPNTQIKGLSRLMGPVAGDLSNIAGGTFHPEDFFSGLDAKIFGVINLWDVIENVLPAKFLSEIEKIPKLTTDVSLDKLEVTYKWEPALKDWENIFIASNGGKTAELIIEAKVCAHLSGKAEVEIDCALSNFSIDLIGNLESFIMIHFDHLKFYAKSGKKADVDVKMGEIEFVGVLAFVETLKDLIPLNGFSDPPSLDVTEQGISAGYSLSLPDVAIGVFSLENVSLGAGFTLPFIVDPLTVRFNFCERQSPFLLTVSMFGGGGFFAIAIDPKGVQSLEASFEFGASLSVNLGVASGGVHVMAGIYYKMEMDKANLTGYFRMGGEVDVLGIISVSIELYLELSYEFSSGKCVGKATLTIEIEILFFSVSVEISCEKKFAGSGGDPSFKELMEPYVDPITELEVKPWEAYCQAFA